MMNKSQTLATIAVGMQTVAALIISRGVQFGNALPETTRLLLGRTMEMGNSLPDVTRVLPPEAGIATGGFVAVMVVGAEVYSRSKSKQKTNKKRSIETDGLEI
jgi:hypothetical protein